MSSQLREENKKLRQENESLRDEIEALRRDVRQSEETRRRDEPNQFSSIAQSVPTPKAETQNQRSSFVPLGPQPETNASRSNIQPISNSYNGPAAASTLSALPSSLAPSTPTQQNTYAGALANLQPREQHSQPERGYNQQQPQPQAPSTHYQYEMQARDDQSRANFGDRYSPAPKLPRSTGIDEVNERVSVNDERFRSTYLRAEDQPSHNMATA